MPRRRAQPAEIKAFQPDALEALEAARKEAARAVTRLAVLAQAVTTGIERVGDGDGGYPFGDPLFDAAFAAHGNIGATVNNMITRLDKAGVVGEPNAR